MRLRSRRGHAVLKIDFDPPQPILNLGKPASVLGELIYDHSEFAVTLTNRSGRPIYLDQVFVTSHGTARRSEVGEARDQFGLPPDRRLEPGQSARLERPWGYTVDTEQQQVSYLFGYCWRGEGEMRNQFSFARVDTFPK